MLNVPNALTTARIVLVPWIAWFTHLREYEVALWLFLVAAASDLLDGFIARTFEQRTRFGAIADPLADKLATLAVTALLALQGWLPWWLAAAIIGRDVLIGAGALAYRLAIGPLEIEPTRLSKLNTVLEFALLAAVLAVGAGHLDPSAWLPMLTWTVLATVLGSGAQYVWLWGRKAAARARQRGT